MKHQRGVEKKGKKEKRIEENRREIGSGLQHGSLDTEGSGENDL
jgi:hypothetical protein